MSLPRALYLAFLLFLIFPYIYLSFHFLGNFSAIMQALQSFDFTEFVWALKNSFMQAALSAIGSLFLGVVLCFGVFELKYLIGTKLSDFVQKLLIVPSLLPALFSILCLINLVDPFPTGLIGVVLVHTFMNAGLVCFFLDRLVQSKLANSLEISFIEGASKFHYIKTILPWISKDILGILFFVFVVCFTSLSVPLLTGGGRTTTLEVLIYEKIKILGNFDQGLLLALLQLIIIFAMSKISFSKVQRVSKHACNFQLLRSKFSLLVLLIFVFLPIIYFAKESILGWEQVQNIPGLIDEVVDVLIPSTVFAISTGFLIGGILLLLAMAGIQPKLFRLVLSFVSPSTALLSLSLLLVMINISASDSDLVAWLLWSLGFTYLVFTTLFRWGWYQELTSLKSQIEVAWLLGANQFRIFLDIIVPQVAKPLAMLSGIGAFWALGDFAMGKFLIGEPKTLAMLIESLLSAYRLQAALALMGLLLLIGLMTMALFYGVEFVYRRTFEKEF